MVTASRCIQAAGVAMVVASPGAAAETPGINTNTIFRSNTQPN